MSPSTIQSDKAEDAFIREIEGSLREEGGPGSLGGAGETQVAELLPGQPFRFVLYYLKYYKWLLAMAALEGTVRTAGESLPVTAQLIDVLTDEHLWADKYSGKLEDVFDTQEQISRKIVDALKMKLSSHEERKLAERPVAIIHAFEYYHRARQELYKFTEDGLDNALRLIQNRLSIFGDNELLYAAKGTVYW